MFFHNSLICSHLTVIFVWLGNCVGGVIVSVVGLWCDSRSYQTKDYKIGICCFSTKHAALRS